jgi:hypothetical protein
MSNLKYYRIKKVSDGYFTYYHPQQRFLGIWWNIFDFSPYDGGFSSYEIANEKMCKYLVPTTVEYLDIDCADTSRTVHKSPNPPPKMP